MAESDNDRPQVTQSSNSDEPSSISPLDIRSVSPLAIGTGSVLEQAVNYSPSPQHSALQEAARRASKSPSIAELVGHQDGSIRGDLERAHDQHNPPASNTTPEKESSASGPNHSGIDGAVLAVSELLFLLLGLPFGDDLYHDKPIPLLHWIYLGIAVICAIGGPMWPTIRNRWASPRIAASIANTARDARIWIAILLIFFLYGVAPDIYRRATMHVAIIEAPSPTKNVPVPPPNLGRTSWFTIFNGLTKPVQTLLLPKWFVIITSPPENAEAEKELNTIFNVPIR
jgi:hypothetical protein